MHQNTRSGFAGLVLGFGLALALGGAQPEGAPAPLPEDPVERELALMHRGLFREQSALPLDPERSIEQMLEAQTGAILRLEKRFAAGTPAGSGAIERRLASIEEALRAVEASDMGAVEREVQDLRRSIGDLDRRVSDVPRSDLGELARTVQELERRLDRDTQRSFTSLESELRDTRSSLRTLEDRLRSLERKIP